MGKALITTLMVSALLCSGIIAGCEEKSPDTPAWFYEMQKAEEAKRQKRIDDDQRKQDMRDAVREELDARGWNK